MKLLLELAGDISFALDHIEKSERVNYLAYYDELTGLANRTLFLERLNQCVQAARLAGDKVALVLADVERFKTVNDSLGRQAGDELLKQLAERLRLGADRGEAARIGADHFAVVLPGIRGRSEVTRRIERIWQDCFSDAFPLGGSAAAGVGQGGRGAVSRRRRRRRDAVQQRRGRAAESPGDRRAVRVPRAPR